jgi:hypothetical protein
LGRKKEELIGVGLFVWERFMEEDGDGMNLIILSDKRIRIEQKMEELSKTLVPAELGDKGEIFFKKSDLYALWEKSKILTKYGK